MRRTLVVAAAGVAVVGAGVVVWRKREALIEGALNLAFPPIKSEELPARPALVKEFDHNAFAQYRLDVVSALVALGRPQAHLTTFAEKLVEHYYRGVEKEFIDGTPAAETAKMLNGRRKWQPDDLATVPTPSE